MMRVRNLPAPDAFPALDDRYLIARPAIGLGDVEPRPRILLLYGSLRERSLDRKSVV